MCVKRSEKQIYLFESALEEGEKSKGSGFGRN